MEKSKGQLRYENDLKCKPSYHDGTPRKTWDQLEDWAKHSWEKEVSK